MRSRKIRKSGESCSVSEVHGDQAATGRPAQARRPLRISPACDRAARVAVSRWGRRCRRHRGHEGDDAGASSAARSRNAGEDRAARHRDTAAVLGICRPSAVVGAFQRPLPTTRGRQSSTDDGASLCGCVNTRKPSPPRAAVLKHRHEEGDGKTDDEIGVTTLVSTPSMEARLCRGRPR